MNDCLEIKFHIDREVLENLEYTETEIKEIIMRYPFSEFTMNEFKILTLDYKEQIKVLPYFDIFNTLIISVSYF